MNKKEALQLCKQYKFRIDTRKIGKYIGEGAHGAVFKYGKDKVIKLSFADYTDDIDDMKKLVSVVRRFKAVPHIHGIGGNGEVYWVTMEYLPRIRACQENLERSLVRFMRFLRVDQTTPWWVHTSPHNYLRITRALDSLCTLSNERAVPIILYRQVMRIAEANPSKLRMSLDNYWTPAMLMKR